jgi:hypothetical protein
VALALVALCAAGGAPWGALRLGLALLVPALALCCAQVYKPAPLAGHQAAVMLQCFLFLLLAPAVTATAADFPTTHDTWPSVLQSVPSAATPAALHAECTRGRLSAWPLAFAKAGLCLFYCGSALNKLRGAPVPRYLLPKVLLRVPRERLSLQ